MKRDVLHDASLGAFSDRFVFVEVDTDKPQNAAFMAKHAVRVWPTFFVVDPATDREVAVYGGSMSLVETANFLREGNGGNGAMAQAYALLQAGQAKQAALAFEAEAHVAGPRRAEAYAAAYRAWRDAKDMSRCAGTAAAALDVVTGSGAVGDTAGYVLLCTDALPDSDPDKKRLRTIAKAKLEALVQTPAASASVDDRADVMATLAEVVAADGDTGRARQLHEQRLKLLEDDAKVSDPHADPKAARVHDYARMNSYLELGRGDDAVKMLRERVSQFPDDYEPHARLASTLVKLKKFAEARPEVERAVALAYGPRRLRYLTLLADACKGLGDLPCERAALTRVLADNAALAPAQQNAELAQAATKRLSPAH